MGFAEALVGKLISQGLTVHPSTPLVWTRPDKISTVISFTLEGPGNGRVQVTLEELKDIMKVIGMIWFSIVVFDVNDLRFTWDVGA